MSNIHVDVVSAEKSIFSGEAKFVALPGEGGELGIDAAILNYLTDVSADLLIMGAYTHSPWRQLFAGSKTTELRRAARVPTLLLRIVLTVAVTELSYRLLEMPWRRGLGYAKSRVAAGIAAVALLVTVLPTSSALWASCPNPMGPTWCRECSPSSARSPLPIRAPFRPGEPLRSQDAPRPCRCRYGSRSRSPRFRMISRVAQLRFRA